MSALQKRMEVIEETTRKQGATSRVDYWYQLRMSVSSPPDTLIHVRGGWVQQGTYWIQQQTIYYPPLDLDFASTAQFFNGYSGTLYSEYTGNFANAMWYMPVLVLYDHSYFDALRDGTTLPPPVKVLGGEPEYATAVEAEQALDGFFGGMGVRQQGDMPLCGVILRNNGTTGTNGQVQAIDPISRGRSYFWRDLRPRHLSLYYDGYY